MSKRRLFAVLAIVIPLAALLGGCAVNPATGQSTFTGLTSTEDEIRIGRQEHPNVVRAFGGEYGSPELRRYVGSIGQLLARTAERPDLKYTFTILNSDVVNAFAMPGGYIYITRGLLALAGNEAELAAVLGHEIGHVTALHHAQRQSQALLANVLVAALGVAAGPQAGQLGGVLGQTVLRSFSREEEHQADELGIRYIARAGYDPRAMASFMNRLRAESQLQAVLRGESPDKIDRFNYLATHPAPLERVQRASAVAAQTPVHDPMTADQIYLGQIDGMLYGDDPEQGFVRGRSFIHAKLRFRFDVPSGFRLFNSDRAVVALGPNGAQIVFDRAPKPSDGSMRFYLTKVWARGAPLGGIESIDINGMDAATAITRVNTQEGVRDARLVAIRVDLQTIYRFLILTQPVDTQRLTVELRRTTYSFNRLSDAEARAIRPYRIQVVRARPGDTVASLAARLPFADFREERFRTLNGLAPGEPVGVGRLVKLIVE